MPQSCSYFITEVYILIRLTLLTLLLLKLFSNLEVEFTNSKMSENGDQFFEDTIVHTLEKVCLVWLNLLKHCFFRIFRKTGNAQGIY